MTTDVTRSVEAAPTASTARDTSLTWYKDAIIYELHVRAFADSNGDGIGDFAGLTARLDYLQQLGITAIWLLPFYPSPMRDGGYDIAAYTSINPEYGTMRDFTRFVREAHRRGMRVITELVVNHTSDQHPWFQRARQAPKGSADRDWYVWSDDNERYAGTRIIFTDTETSNWAWDPVAGQHYWHRFFSHQPDLNYANPRVRQAILSVMRFWLDRGVDGLRLDAVPYLCEREGTNNENLPETHEVIREWRAYLDQHYPDRMLLAEANQWPEDVRAYFGDGDECHMAFHFPVMPRLFMSLRQEDRRPITDIMARTPVIPETCQWGLFLRNHDELTLEMVTDEERDYMYSIYATDPRMRVNVGIRRRLAPLLDGNRRAIELLHALLFSLPGTPILYYGDEIGMGDNVFLGDRDGVRTPMQWSGDRNAGFSRADPARVYLPPIMDPLYGYQAVNVEAQERSASSLLNWMRRMIALRGRRSALGRGDLVMLHPSNRSVLAFLRRSGDEVMLVVANLSRFVQPVELDLSSVAGMVPVEVIGQQPFPPIEEEAPYFLTLGPHTFFWFDLVPPPETALPEGDAPLVPIEGDWPLLFEGAARDRLEREILPVFLQRQRWFGGKRDGVEHVALREAVPLHRGSAPTWLVLVDTPSGDATYTLLLGVATGRAGQRLRADAPGAILARVESGRGAGVLFDASGSERLGRQLFDLIAEEDRIDADGAAVTGQAFAGFSAAFEAMDDPPRVVIGSGEQSNTTFRFGRQVMLKLLRRFEEHPHPEVEVGRHLADVPGLAARLIGAINLDTPGASGPIAVAHEFVVSRDTGWDFSVAACRRFLDEHTGEEAPPTAERPPLALATEAEAPAPGTLDPLDDRAQEYAAYMRALGETTARLHLALADARGDRDFEPQPLTAGDLQAVADRIRDRLARATEILREFADSSDARLAANAATVLDFAGRVDGWLDAAVSEGEGVTRIRVHGDYHLGQVLLRNGSFVVLDFEGEVGLPIEQRRARMSAFADVAGMVRSINYASLVARRAQEQTYPDVAAALDRLDRWMLHWEQPAVGAFLAAYFEAAGDAPFLPAAAGQRRALLDLHLLDKALHELHYEIAHRSDWAWLPLEGLARMARQIEAGA